MKITNLQTVVPAVVTINDGPQVFVCVNLQERQVYLPCSQNSDLIPDWEEFTEQVLAEFAPNPTKLQIPQPPQHMVATVSALQSDSEHRHEELKERTNVSER